MARPSLKKQRVTQILDAYERCVARYGVEAATLERIAEEAELARPLIRHNIGNRDDILNAMFDRFMEKSDDYQQALIALLPENNRIPTLIDWLFDEEYADENMVLVANALIAAAPQYPDMAKRLIDWTQSFVDCIAGELRNAHPQAANDAVTAVATGIAGIYFNVDALSILGEPDFLRGESKQAAKRLAAGLAGNPGAE